MTSLTKTPSFKGLVPASKLSSEAKRRNRGTDTAHEVMLRRFLWRRGLRFRKNVKTLPGKPDIVFSRFRLVVFCDGDFWHGRDWQALSDKLKAGTNSNYWVEKIRSNRERDLKNVESLRKSGWTVLRFWESDIHESLEEIGIQIAQKLHEIAAQQNRPIDAMPHRFLGQTP